MLMENSFLVENDQTFNQSFSFVINGELFHHKANYLYSPPCPRTHARDGVREKGLYYVPKFALNLFN